MKLANLLATSKQRRASRLTAICALSLGVLACAATEADSAFLTTADAAVCPTDLSSTRMLAVINQFRSIGRTCGSTYHPPAEALLWNQTLTEAAQAHSRDMAARNYMGHTSPEGLNHQHRATLAGYTAGVGENIAAGSPTLASTMAIWLKSEGHCANLMNPRYKEFGMACAASATSKHRVYWTQVFGTRA